MDSFIINFWMNIFNKLRYLSLFELLRKIYPKARTGKFVDGWVLVHTFLPLGLIFLIRAFGKLSLIQIFIYYGYLRVFEVFVYQVNVMFFDELKAMATNRRYSIISARRSILLLIHNFVEIILWFALSYYFNIENFELGNNHSLAYILITSFSIMTNFGRIDFKVISNTGLYIMFYQSIIGLFMTLISLARFVSLLPPPIDDSVDKVRNSKRKK